VVVERTGEAVLLSSLSRGPADTGIPHSHTASSMEAVGGQRWRSTAQRPWPIVVVRVSSFGGWMGADFLEIDAAAAGGRRRRAGQRRSLVSSRENINSSSQIHNHNLSKEKYL
jgi:hypothetical protein